jgi:D-2-hydroxyacid dehydrogenase (NADP+)
VFREEPLPAAGPLWSLPNVIVTPHVGGMSDRYAEQVLPQLRDNVGAWLRGGVGGLRNVVRSWPRAGRQCRQSPPGGCLQYHPAPGGAVDA